MALRSVHLLLLLWGLTLFVHGGTSFCNVTCSTDYNVTVNCSCSAPLPTYSVLVQVSCRDGYEFDANSSCEIKAPRPWCVMYSEDLEDVTSIGTMCTSTVTQQDARGEVMGTESSSWELSQAVKALPPLDVRVTSSGKFYNITWDHSNRRDFLTYRVRVRESRNLSEDPALLYFVEEQKHTLFEHMKLRPRVNYIVDVAAKMSPDNLYIGPWSEWSSSVEWTTAGGSAEIEGMNKNWLFFLLSFVVLGVVLVYYKKTYLHKKLQLITYIPRPQEFFYYEGNFKDWVKPVFSEYDYLSVNSHVQRKSEKQPNVLQWKNEKHSFSEHEIKQGGHHFLHLLPPHSNPPTFLQAGGSSQGSGHSSGHISIHTVTLSGEGEFEEEVSSTSSVNTLQSYRDGESFASFEENNRELAGYNLEERQLSRSDGHGRMLPQPENQISNDLSADNFEPNAMINEPERLSLDSFVSHGQSEDGYPHVDLDTVDSGFGECSSPGASDSNMAGQRDLFQEHENSNSNYVKQWMICSTIQEDSSNTEQTA